jgi:UDP:flavonoid glycosyltransferase YjiC (YdhE family)
MTAIERARAGRLVRSGEATPSALRTAFSELLESNDLREGARNAASAFARANCHERFQAWLEEVLGTNERRPQHENPSAN